MISYMKVIHIESLCAMIKQIWHVLYKIDLKRSEVKSNINSGFLGHGFLYDGNTYWVTTGNNKADIA